MSELVVKDNALMNASYNLALVEQRLILLAIIEARESGKGINANDPLTVHAESYISHFRVEKHTAYQALKDACNEPSSLVLLIRGRDVGVLIDLLNCLLNNSDF
jgi:plasmid replication initiation protein